MHSSATLQLRRISLDGDVFESREPSGLASRDSIEMAAAVLPVFYPKGGMFFMEGQSVTGVFLLRSGRAKESMVSKQGKTAIVRVVGPGAILGLSAVLTDMPHESTAETIEPTHADFLRKAPFLRLLKTSAHLSQIVAAQLSSNCKEAYAVIRCLGLSGSVAERLARLLLQWAEHPLPNQNGGKANLCFRVTLTHEEISQFVGSTRETMSRILSGFREKKWITMNGRIWSIDNESAIRRLAAV
jgi:CRP/FNR family transcriptional regulator, cyclic AMP receptor protein